ncbi:hypothetical protein G6K91_20365 [Agrobacterium rhizogenes]|nr:hypothetical protein [Rhizobium rhizogenes]NTG55873.1 hypothetical protein [Rhizobium rhizogenes]NTH01785.1 hypothetical protein [Rhizobium rhizogenes]NTI57496.1 hypothetical protein [Rhizobium rhizogenes]
MVDNPDQSGDQSVDSTPQFDKDGNPNFDTEGNYHDCHGAGCLVDKGDPGALRSNQTLLRIRISTRGYVEAALD